MKKDKSNVEYPFISLEDIAEGIAEALHRKGYKEIVTFDELAQYAIDAKKVNSEIIAFVISVKKNYDPQNENDKFVIVQGLLGENNKPISLDGKESESRIIHTKTIDKKLLDVLNGAEAKIIKF